jgi:hypothetical protein
MNGVGAFSDDYVTARARFRAAAADAGCVVESHPIGLEGPDGTALTVDVARKGEHQPGRLVVVSSGLHGVEGFFGSAIQLSLLQGELRDWTPPPGVAVLLAHALNPYGFAHVRRFDERNVDLNRNFLRDGETYAGSPRRYGELDPFLNPPFAPATIDPFLPRAAWAIVRFGFKELKQIVAGGQYDFPRGLFFGGRERSPMNRRLRGWLPEWIGPAERVLHLDFHTGLGRWADYRLLVDSSVSPERRAWLDRHFGAGRVEVGHKNGLAYRARGDLNSWCEASFADRSYICLCAEFGTYSPLNVLRALRDENQAHHWSAPDAPASRRAKAWLKEAFVPADAGWRNAAVGRGVGLVRRAIEIAGEPAGAAT